MINEKSRTWNLILYPNEDDTHYQALKHIENTYLDYAYIEHNQDRTKTNELKKPHVHLTIRFNNARYRNSIALELGISPNYMQKCESLEKSLQYLIHYGIKDKYQYDLSEVKGNLKEKLEKILETTDLTENEKLSNIISYINSYYGYLSMGAFMNYITTTPLLNTYRKFAYSIHQLIYEHNLFYTEYNKKEKN